ncbi:hypothetical protein GQ54DRAFT_249248, partial [Martensiomyces pterosporus]
RNSSRSGSTTGSTIYISSTNEDRILGLAGVPREIDNKGSTARDFYAAERNYLSWLRLALAIMSTGMVALTDFNGSKNTFPGDIEMSRFYYWLSDLMDSYSWPIGVFLFFLAAFTILAALVAFFHAHAQLAVQRRPLRWAGTLLMATTLAIVLSTIVVAVATI